MKTLKLTSYVMMLLLFAACGGGGEDEPTPAPKPEQKPVINITSSNSSPVVEQKGGTTKVEFTTDAPWTASVSTTANRNSSWISVSPTSGSAGSHTLNIATTANDTPDERNASITLKAGTTTKTFTVSQKQKDALTVTSNKVEMESKGGEATIEVKANIKYDYEIEESAQSWITKAATRGLTTTTIKLQVAENGNTDKREGKITIRSTGLPDEVVTIYQAAATPSIVLTQKEYSVGSAGETLKIELKSNVEVELQKPTCDWITEASTRAFSSSTYYFIVAPNNGYDSRSDSLFFLNKANGIREKVTITQMQKSAIIVAKNEYTVPQEGGVLDFKVNTNVEFTVSVSADWIKQTATRGLVEKPLHFTVEANTTSDARKAVITITDGTEKQEIKVTQEGPQFKDEREALIAFYKAAGGDNWTRKDNWCSDKPLNEWYGVQLDNNGKVYSLSLRQNNLAGTIHSGLGELSNLLYIDLAGNALRGNFPEFLCDIKNLQGINFGANNLTGELPSNIGNLRNLRWFLINHNKLSGKLPESFSYIMDSIEGENLYLLSNRFSGTLPASVTKHARWSDLWINIVAQNKFDLSDANIPVPAFTATDINGATISSAEEYAKNKYTILYRWATWDESSAEFTNQLLPLYEYYKEKGVEVIGFCDGANSGWDTYSTVQGVKDFVAKNKIPWRNFVMGEAPNPDMITDFTVSNTVPAIYVIKDNKLVFQPYTQGYYDLPNFLIKELGPVTSPKYYTSTDYSKDGEVFTIQTATTGKGVDLVFMGEGFVDKDMEKGGAYEQRMAEFVEQLFAVEPYKSLRNRFNVYGVKVVSPNAEFATGATQRINENNSMAFDYAQKALPNADIMSVAVVYNTTGYVDRSYCAMYSDESFVAYIMEKTRPTTLNHEVCGHGIAKLADEYVEPGNENLSLPDNEKASLETRWAWGWYLNVDWHSAQTEIRWAHFLSDSRYKDEVGIYEGAYLYGKGAYRPSDDSMMRYNIAWFNAPGREAIYKKVMQRSEGYDWKYDYEEFVKFDENNRGTMPKTRVVSGAEHWEWQKRHRPPVFIEGTWRDALKEGRGGLVPLR